MTKIKITVIKRFAPEDVFGKEYIAPSGKKIERCNKFTDNQEFISEDLTMPEGFCSWAWNNDIYLDAKVLNFEGNFWKTWTEEGTMFTACSDGVRPVCFKLERIDE
ncbi:MAG: TIGR04076 family protein [Candidatus Heimdallarchaeota archaeon]|nr:TIGR04076 family protein [Candidatus Heimdallarchaeota archaeon]